VGFFTYPPEKVYSSLYSLWPTVRRANCRAALPLFSRPGALSLGRRGLENASMRHRLGHVEPHISEGIPCATCHAGQGERAHERSGKQYDAEMPANPAWRGMGPAPTDSWNIP